MIEYAFSIPKSKEDWRQCSDLNAHVSEKQRHVSYTAEFKKDRPDPLGAWWGFYFHEALCGQDEGHLIREASQPVDSVNKGCALRIGANFTELFVATVHVTHDWFGDNDLLAV